MENYALIDIDSHRIRMTLIRIKNKTYTNILDIFSQPTSIGKDVVTDGILKQSTISDVISIVKTYEDTALKNGACKIMVAAYGFLEKAKNYSGFMDSFFNSTGYQIHLIRDNDEANAIFSSVVTSIDQPKGIICCITSTNVYIISYTKKSVVNFKKLPLANVFENASSREEVYNKIREDIRDLDVVRDFDGEPNFIVCGPAFRTLGKISRKILKDPLDAEHMYQLTSDQFKTVNDFIDTLSDDKILKIKGISSESSKYLLNDLTIIRALIDGLNIEKFVVSANGIKEGLIENLIVKPVTERSVFDVLTNSIDNIRAFYDFDFEQSDLVYKFALILFKQLKVVHKLHRSYVKPLRVAASLYNCGRMVNIKNDPKYSFAIITNSNIYGLTQRELVLAGFVCLCQNLDNFNLAEWMKYQNLFIESDLEAVRKLGIIVKFAASFAKYKTTKLQDIECDILGDSVIMKTIADGPVKFEILEAKKLSSDFKKIYKKSLEII